MPFADVDALADAVFRYYELAFKNDPHPSERYRCPTRDEVRLELVALDEAFPGKITAKSTNLDAYIAMRTDDVVLDGVNLGPFDVKFKFAHLTMTARTRDVFIVRPVSPVCSRKDPGVYHPHRDGDSLCFGDGDAVLGLAAREGRVLDAFQIVLAVLNHYNPHDRYGSISNWRDPACRNCAAAIADRPTSCAYCGTHACTACRIKCPTCKRTWCKSCNNANARTNPHDPADETKYCIGCVSVYARRPTPKVTFLDGRQVRVFGSVVGLLEEDVADAFEDADRRTGFTSDVFGSTARVDEDDELFG